MLCQDQALLTLSEKKHERECLEYLKSLYEVEPVEYNGANFTLVKMQLLKLLDGIILLNPQDFEVFRQYRQNIETNLTEETSSSDIDLTLKTVKNTLEAAYSHIQDNPKKIDRANFNVYTVIACLSGAASHILTICDHYLCTDLTNKLIHAKKKVILSLAVDFIRMKNLLPYIGNEIHWANGLFNTIANQYGLLLISDHLIPATINDAVLQGFSNFVANKLNFRAIVSVFIQDNPPIKERSTYQKIELFLKGIGCGDGGYLYRLYSPNEQNTELAVKNPEWFDYRYELVVYEVLIKNGWLTEMPTLVLTDRMQQSITLVRLQNQVCVLMKASHTSASASISSSVVAESSCDIRLLTSKDIGFIRDKNFNPVFQFIENDLTLLPEALLSVFVERFQQEFNIGLLQSLLTLPATEAHDKAIAFALNQRSHLKEELIQLGDDMLPQIFLKTIQNNYMAVFETILHHTDNANQALAHDGETLLYVAAKHNRIEMLKKILEKPLVDINRSSNLYNITPLSIATEKGHLAAVEALIKVGANIDAADTDARTPLWIAAHNGHLAVVEALIKVGANKDAANTNGLTPLFIAAEKGHLAVVEALIKVGANKDAAKTDGATPLFMAAQEGYLTVVEALIKAGANKDAAKTDGATPLLIAVHSNHLAVVEALIKVGANKDAAIKNGATPLFMAAQKGHLAVVEALIKAGANKDAAKTDGATPLLIAAEKGHLAVVEALIKVGANKDAAKTDGATPLFMAAQKGHLAVVEALIKVGANKDAAIKNGETPLLIAAHNNHLAVVEALIKVGANKDAATTDGVTPLLMAVHNNHLAVVEALIKVGANKDAATTDGVTPLLIAAHNGHLAVVEALIKVGANKDAAIKNGVTPLFMAAQEGHLAVVEALIKVGANKDAATTDGATPLFMAAQEGHLAVVEALIKVGANKDAATTDGATPLFMAAQKGHLAVVEALIKVGANKNAAIKNGVTPLFIAAQNGHLAVVEALIKVGANKDAATTDGATPLFMAAQKGHLAVVEALIKVGANKDAATTDGATPLFMAAQKGHLAVVEVLIKAVANKEAALKNGETPLSIAKSNGYFKIVDVLKQPSHKMTTNTTSFFRPQQVQLGGGSRLEPA